jgi:hypothetical protein
VKVASDGSLYYIGRGSSSSGGGLYRIQYTQNTPPAITVHPQGKNVTVGDPVTFSVSASGTTPLSYQWQRNGANISGATAASFTIASAQNADDGDAFRCRVSNAYGNVMSNAAILGVTPSLAPVAGISSPLAGTTYSGGQTISYSGTGTDPEDGNLPASAFEWEIVLHHDTHTHPFLAPTTGSKSGSFIVPRTGHTEDNVWYRIHLTVTDSDGLSHSVFRDVIPRKTTMTFVTVPSGLQITLEGQPLTTPATVVGVEGIERTLGVISPQTKSGTTYTFASWSDGGAATHDILTPVSNTTFTATFSGGGPTPTPGPSGLIPTNGGFESGSTGPTGWTLETSATSGNWTWDSTTFAKGARSAKLTVAGTAAKRSPYLRSAEFELEPGKAYTFSVWTRTAGTGGSAPPAIRVVELDANGNTLLDAGGANIQHGIQAPLGTSGWTLRTLAIVTDPRCVRGKVTANIPNGYGTFWVDAVRID